MAKAIELNKRMYNFWYSAEDGDIFTPEVVVHGAEPWLKLTNDNELLMLIGSHYIRAKGEWKVIA